MTSAVLSSIREKIDISSVSGIEFVREKIATLSERDVIDLLQSVRKSLPVARSSSEFSFASNLILSGFVPVCSAHAPGAAHPLSEYILRSRRIREVCYYAASYLDQIVMFDPFVNEKEEDLIIDDHFRGEFSFFIYILAALDPLIEENIVTFYNPADQLSGSQISRLMKALPQRGASSIPEMATDLIIKNSKIFLLDIDADQKIYRARVDGPEDFFGASSHEIEFNKDGRILRKKDIGQQLKSSKASSLTIYSDYFNFSIRDLLSRTNVANSLGITKNFSSGLEIKILSSAFGQEANRKTLGFDSPILMADSFNDLISMRKNEWHHFETYRQAVKTLSETKQETNAEAIYREEIMPEMIKIERIIEKNKDSGGREIIKNAGVAGFSIISSIATSGFSTILSSIGAIIGAGSLSQQVIPEVQKIISTPSEAKDSQYYFAWKIKRR